MGEILKVLCNCNELSRLSFLKDCNSRFLCDTSFGNAWKESINNFSCSLKQEDKDVLYSFGSELGKTDVDGQLSICELHKSLFEDRLNDAKRENEKYGKLYSRLGLLAGVFIVILLI